MMEMTAEQAMLVARASYERDARFRAMTQQAAHRAVELWGDDDSIPARDVHRIAHVAASLVLEAVLTEDRELAAMREDRDRYKKIAEDALLVAPPRIFLNQEQPAR